MEQLFGTNGIRGVVNDRMNAEFATEIGMAIGTYAKRRRIAIGTDGRTSNEMLKYAVTSGLVSTGCDVIDLGIMPTPVVQYAVPHFGCRFGVTITASHNPPEFNGIKTADSDGGETRRQDEEEIERIYYAKEYARASWADIGTMTKGDIIPHYIDRLCSLIDTKVTSAANLLVVLDCGNGTSSLVTPKILERLGCKIVTLNAQIDGKFPAHPSEPTPDNAAQLIKTVKALGADLGIIQDGDGDRTIFVDDLGNFIPGERSMALIAKSRTSNPSAIKGRSGIVVTPVNASMCVEDVVKANSCRIEYTRIGSPSVIWKMKETRAIFGGEEAGGLVYPEFQYAKDGMMTAAKMVELVAGSGRKFSSLLSEIPMYYVHKSRISCPDAKKAKVLDDFKKRMQKKGLKTDTTDGVKIFFKGGWVLVRPSGTEPIYRIFVETKDKKESEKISKEYIADLEKAIKKL